MSKISQEEPSVRFPHNSLVLIPNTSLLADDVSADLKGQSEL